MKKVLFSTIFLIPSLLFAEEPKQKSIEEASDCEIKLEICNTQVQFVQADKKVQALAEELKKREGKESSSKKKDKKNE